MEDVIGIIANYLSPIDNYHLTLTNKFFHKYVNVKTSIVKMINNRLSEIFAEQVDDFKKYMKENDCIISGSFVLQCILGEYWPNSDIDLCVLASDQKYLSIEKFLLNSFAEYGNNGDGYTSNQVSWVRNYFNRDNIQVIAINMYQEQEIYNLNNFFDDKFVSNIELLKIFVDEMADFAVYKNIYYHDGNDHLILNNLNDIFTRTTNYVCKYPIKESLERYHKYSERGFTFPNKNLLSFKDFDSYFVRVGLNKNYTSSTDEVIKFFGDNISNIKIRNFQRDEESKCVDGNFPSYHPNDGICYVKSCIVKFLNSSLHHCHLEVGYRPDCRENDFIIIL